MKMFNFLELRKKWYLHTWFISFVFSLSFLIVPLFIGIVLLIMQILDDKRLVEEYGKIDNIQGTIDFRQQELDRAQSYHDSKIKEFGQKEQLLNSKIQELETQLDVKRKDLDNYMDYRKEERMQIEQEIINLEKDVVCKQYDFSDYDGLTSEDCKNKLAIIKQSEQEHIKSSLSAVGAVGRGEKKLYTDNSKQILRCFNTECDNVLLNLSAKNIEASRSKITKSFESLNSVFKVDNVSLDKKLLEFKLEELNLVYTYELKKEQEKEIQKAIREQMIEEEKVRREIEQQKNKIEKDQIQCNNEVHKLIAYMQKAQTDVEKQIFADKIKELEEKIRQLEADKATVLEREANARAGYVYIISNIGSFGDGIYKIGMTRRLEPFDRIKELSSASVPFEFDVHAMIFSDDAPALELALHQKFEKQSVNRINLRKEFFRVSIDEIEKTVKDNYNNTVEFTRIPVAKEYNATLDILKKEAC